MLRRDGKNSVLAFPVTDRAVSGLPRRDDSRRVGSRNRTRRREPGCFFACGGVSGCPFRLYRNARLEPVAEWIGCFLGGATVLSCPGHALMEEIGTSAPVGLPLYSDETNRPTEPVGSVRRGGTPVVVGIEKERLESSRRSFVNRIRWRLFARVQAYLDPLGRFAPAVFHRGRDEDVAGALDAGTCAVVGEYELGAPLP